MADEKPDTFKIVFDAVSGTLQDLIKDQRLAAMPPDLFFMQVLSVVANGAAACGIDPTSMLRAQYITAQRGGHMSQLGSAVHAIATKDAT